MGDKGSSDAIKKQPKTPQEQTSLSPKDPLDQDSSEARPHNVPESQAPFISAPLYVPSVSSSPFEQQKHQQQQFDTVNPKRTRFTATGQWKLLPSPSSQQKQTQMAVNIHGSSESSPSPTTNPNLPLTIQQPHTSAASSSDTASSPILQSPTKDGSKLDSGDQTQVQYQFRKGKFVSPVWKPNEMLLLARAWRVQYQGGSDHNGSGSSSREVQAVIGGQSRGKTRADKDKEVAEFLRRHGINRDAKTAGTKWDNMLGEFRKVYEWERGDGREQVGKSYFRLSPYERKLHRLPASFDEDVFEELSQFMGSRMRSSQTKSSSILSGHEDINTPGAIVGTRTLPPPPPFREDELPLSVKTKQLVMSGGVGEHYYYGTRGSSLGFEASLDHINAGHSLSYSTSKELRRIGKIRMTWEESVSLWAEEGEQHRGRIRLQGLSFLHADELSFFDDGMVSCTLEAFEDGSLKGFSVDRFESGRQVKVLGRRKSLFASASASSAGITDHRIQLPYMESSIRSSMTPLEYQDPTEYYVGCLRVPPPSLPTLFELSWHLQEPPSEELRIPIRKDVYRDLPQGKELLFTTSTELLDSRSFTYDILGPIIRSNPSLTASTTTSRESYIGLWDDCINRVVSKFCSNEMLLIRQPNSPLTDSLQDQWPNMTGFIRNFCLWRGEETDQVRDGHIDPSNSIVEKLLWTYTDMPYILGYYAVGHLVTFCALSRAQDRVVRTDLCSLDLSIPSERLKTLVPCYRIAGLLPLLADRCLTMSNCYSDFERIDLGGRAVLEMTPNTMIRFYSRKRKWAAVKEIYDFLDHRIPHAEFIFRSSEKELALVFKPRGCKSKPTNCDQLIESLKNVTKALVALHDLSFMHRDISWDKVMRGNDRDHNEWFLCGFDDAVGVPQIYPHGSVVAGEIGETAARGRHAPELERGLHGAKVDVWGVGYLVKTCGLSGLPKMLRELQDRCMDQNPEKRPTAADCYHHLLQIQSSMSASTAGLM